MSFTKILGSPQLLIRRNQYLAKAFGTAHGNLVALWALNEASGTTARDSSGNGYNAAYVNGPTLGQTGIGDGGVCPLFVPGSNTYVNPFSSGFAAAFNGQEGTFAIWCRVRAASVWTDGASRYINSI